MNTFNQPMSQFMRVGPYLAMEIPSNVAGWNAFWGFSCVVRNLDQIASVSADCPTLGGHNEPIEQQHNEGKQP